MAHERPDLPVPCPPTPAGVRRAYVAPRLRHLGSVRDLTLGNSNRAGEGGRRRGMM